MDPPVITKHVLLISRKRVWAAINHSAQFGGWFGAKFTLTDADGGTALTITASGFERLPPARRREAIESNKGGWTHQAALIAKSLARQS